MIAKRMPPAFERERAEGGELYLKQAKLVKIKSEDPLNASEQEKSRQAQFFMPCFLKVKTIC